MPASQARVPTDRAGRYLAQLSSHTTNMSHGLLKLHRQPAQPRITGVDGDESEAVITFARGRCVLQATTDALVLRAEAEDVRGLERIQEGIARRLEQIGRRDGLTVVWRPIEAEQR